MDKKEKIEQGSITVEATIALSAFMFAIVTILTIVNICIVQAKMAYAVNATARQISQYSYLYSITHLNDSQSKLYKAGMKGTEGVSTLVTDVNDVFNQIEGLDSGSSNQSDGVEGILNQYQNLGDQIGDLKTAGSKVVTDIEALADDPKSVIFGLAKLGASKGFDAAKSLIIAPIAKGLCKKNLVAESGGDVNSLLKSLGVVPTGTGSYYDALDFSKSKFYPNGSTEIQITVEYDVKVIPLLPFDWSFHFCQTAITQGWSAGDIVARKPSDMIDNNTLWTEATLEERSNYIRKMGIAELQDNDYLKTRGLTDVQMYKPGEDGGEFAMIASMNPLWSEGEPAKTLDDIDDDAIRTQIERLCAKMKSTTDGLDKVTVREKDVYGNTVSKEVDCAGAKNKIVLVIPQDEGLDTRIQNIINEANKRGVEIELVTSYGNGARQSKKTTEPQESN